MGLDVYLYTKAKEVASNEHEEAWEAWYDKYKDTSDDDAEKKAAKEALPPYSSSSDDEVASSRYPDHLFNRRYLRSSYNSGGFNRAVPDIVGEDHDLHWIFEPVRGETDEYSFELTVGSIKGLKAAKKRALQVAQEIRDNDALRVMSVDVMLGGADHLWSQLPTDDEVLDWYRDERKRRDENIAKRELAGKDKPAWGSEDGGYSNAKGFVAGFDKGLEILAISVCANPLAAFSAQFPPNTKGGQLGQTPSAAVVYRLSQETKDSYIQSAEITAEFCEEAIALIERDGSAFLHWSG
jgi:hypothetical protein